MSSTYQPHSASYCTDRNPATFCHTDAAGSTDPWLSVARYQAVGLIQRVRIFNRADCCQDRLSPFQIWVSMSSGDYNSSTSRCCTGWSGSFDLTVPASAGPFVIRCQWSATDLSTDPWLDGASHVTLVLPGSGRILNIGEIEASGV